MGRRERRELDSADYELMGLPKSLWPAHWGNFKDLKQVDQISAFLSRLHEAFADGDGLFIVGPQMSGKSYLSAYIAKLFRSYNYSVQWAGAVDIQDNVQSRSQWHAEEGRWLSRYRDVDILIVDALGTEIDATKGRNHVKELIEYRKSWNKLTILNSHKMPEELDEIYNPGYSNWLKANFTVILMNKLIGDELVQKYK